MGADGPVRHAAGHPDDAFVHVLSVSQVHALADEFHDPGFVLVGNGEGLSLGGIAVFIGQFHNDVNGLAGRLGALQGNIDKGAVIYSAGLVFQLRPAAPGGFRYDELELVHVAYGLVGMGHLGNLGQGPLGIPVENLDLAAFPPVFGRLVVKLPVDGMGIGRIGNQDGTVRAGTPADDDVGAGAGIQGTQQGGRGHKGFQKRFSHGILGFFELLRNFVG